MVARIGGDEFAIIQVSDRQPLAAEALTRGDRPDDATVEELGWLPSVSSGRPVTANSPRPSSARVVTVPAARKVAARPFCSRASSTVEVVPLASAIWEATVRFQISS